MPARAAQGFRMSGVTGCWGTSWSEQLDGKELRGALGSAIGTEWIHRLPNTVDVVSPSFFVYYSAVC